jgi:hypothetical protein
VEYSEDKTNEKREKKIIDIKSNVEDFESFFSRNKETFKNDMLFTFDSTLNSSDVSTLKASNRPVIEMNIVKPFINRLISDFSKQVPDLYVSGSNMAKPELVKAIEGYVRHKFSQSDFKYKASRVMTDSAGGGWSVLKIKIDYENDSSLQKDIFIDYADPTMCGFDPMSKERHKGDGEFCYELIPMTKERVKQDYPDFDFDKANTKSIAGGFKWKASNGSKDIYYFCDYHEKSYKKTMLYHVSDPQDPRKLTTMTKEEYFKKYPDVEFAPKIQEKKSRNVCCGLTRYQFIGDQLVAKPEKMKHRCLPLIFVDGRSVTIDGKQLTESYISDAKDAQRVTNITYSSTMYEVLTMRQADMIIAEDALPEHADFAEAYKDPATARSAFVHKAYDNSDRPLPEPKIIGRGQINPTIVSITDTQMKNVQNILGSYEAQMGQQNNLSGKSIVESSINSSASAYPYIESYMESLQQLGKCMIELFPLYFTATRDIPVICGDGVESKITINDSSNQETICDFNPDHMGIKVVAGVNFEVQRQKSLAMLIQLMNSSEGVKHMIESKGLPILFDNVEIRDRSKLVEMSREFMEAREKAAANQPNPQQLQMQAMQSKVQSEQAEIKLKAQKLQLESQEMMMKHEVEMEKVRQAREKLEVDAMDIQNKAILRTNEAHNSEVRTQAELLVEQSKDMRAHERHKADLIKDVAELSKV